MARDELTDQANVIVLVRLQRVEAGDAPWEKRFVLQKLEFIKGAGEPIYFFNSYGSRLSDNDFQLHHQKKFWESDIGRSKWPCCLCGPDHAFRSGRTYVFFPDKLGAVKSAEVVAGASDRWLKYVRERVASNANQSSKQTGASVR